MVQSIHAVLRNALESAVREEVIPRNVAKLVKVTTPKYTVNRGLTVAQARAGTQGRQRRTPVRALRPGALPRPAPWRAARPALGRHRPRRRHARSSPDPSAGRRRTALRPAQDRGLRPHHPAPAAMHQRAPEHGGSSSPSEPTPGRTGKRTGSSSRPASALRWSPTTSAGAGAASAPTAGLTGTRFHDMRHTCVSLLLDLGVPPDMVREIVGHSDIEVTMTIYAHTSPRRETPGTRQAGRRTGLARTATEARGCRQRCRQTPRSEKSAGAFALVRGGGQGRGRTADLPLFRRTLIPTELPDLGWAPTDRRGPRRRRPERS